MFSSIVTTYIQNTLQPPNTGACYAKEIKNWPMYFFSQALIMSSKIPLTPTYS